EAALAQDLQEREPVAPGQTQIEQQQLEGLGAQHLGGGRGVVDPVHGEALALQSRADRLADHGVVFHQQQPHLRSMINRADERARSLGLSAVELSAAERLVKDVASLGVRLTDADAGRLLALLEELARWNRRYNLTGVRTLGAMVTHHLLDSLAIHPDLEGTRIADVGTGAGFPGLPLAVANPARHFTLIDSTAKKIRFASHAAETLGLANVTALQARVETVRPAGGLDTVGARAFAPAPQQPAPAGGRGDRTQ